MKSFQKRGLLGFIAVIFSSAMLAHGAVVYSTGFDTPTYSDGALLGQDSWTITGTSTVNPLTVANTATNGTVTLTTTGQDAYRAFTPAATSDSVFLAADITVSAAGTGDYFLHLGDGTTTDFYARLYAKATTGGFLMAMGTSSGAATYGTTVLSLNTTYHIVARYDIVSGVSNDTGALYVNPVDPLGLTDTPYVAATTTGADATTISSVNLRQGTTGSAPGVTIDNITVTEAPEPASLGLLAIAGLGLVRRKR